MSDELACGRCGSRVLRHVQYGYPVVLPQTPAVRLGGCVIGEGAWDGECLTCGQRSYFMDDDSSAWTNTGAQETGVATAVQQYAAQAREALGTSQVPVISYAGLWLLLASLAPVATDVPAISRILGCSPDEAKSQVDRLLGAAHPTLGTAIGGWVAEWAHLTQPLPIELEPIPSQADLDRWATTETRGLIARFPLEVMPETMLLLASALVLTPRWQEELAVDDDGMLLLEHDAGVHAIVATRAAGPVAVAKPFTAEAIDVISVIAAPEVGAADVWAAVDEVVQQLDSGDLWNHEIPGEYLTDGHAWQVIDRLRTFVDADAPADGEQRWLSRLPVWSADATHDLLDAPGVAEITAPVAARLPEESDTKCVQAATAKYDANGFSAAAVTAMGFRATGIPHFVDRTVRQVEVTFDRPHAVIAIARGGAWEGLPLFHAWVTPHR